MAKCTIGGAVIMGVSSAVPSKRFDNAADATGFSEDEVRKVIGMAGVKSRHMAGESVCSSDLCQSAAESLLERIG